MPKVEQYGAQRVDTQNVRGPRASGVAAGAFGGPIAQGIGDLGEGLMKFGIRRDTTEAEDALIKFERAKNDMFFNPETGYFNKQGRDAYDGAKETTKSLDALRRQFYDGLTTQGARDAFDKVAQNHVTRGQADIMQHATKGMLAWETATIEAQAENAIESGSLYFNDPKELAVNHELGRQAVVEAAKLKGLDGEVLAENLQSFTSSYYTAAIGTGIDKGYAQGKALLEAHKKKLEGPDLRKLESALEAKRKSEETQNSAATAISESRRIYREAADMDEAMRMVEEITDPKIYKATRSELRTRYAQDKQDAQVAQADAWETAQDHILRGGTGETFMFENPDMFDRLSPVQQAKIELGELTMTDPVILNTIQQMSVDQLKSLDINDYNHSLSAADRKTVAGLVKDAREGKFSFNVQTEAQQIQTLAEKLIGKPKSDWKDKQNAQAITIYNYVNERVSEYLRDNKVNTIPANEYTKILNSAGSQLIIESPGLIWDSTDEYTLLDIPELDANGAPLIPQLENILRSRGEPVTVDNLLQLWRYIEDNRD